MNIEVNMVQKQELTEKLCHLCGVTQAPLLWSNMGCHLCRVTFHTYTIQGLHPPDLTIQQSIMSI